MKVICVFFIILVLTLPLSHWSIINASYNDQEQFHFIRDNLRRIDDYATMVVSTTGNHPPKYRLDIPLEIARKNVYTIEVSDLMKGYRTLQDCPTPVFFFEGIHCYQDILTSGQLKEECKFMHDTFSLDEAARISFANRPGFGGFFRALFYGTTDDVKIDTQSIGLYKVRHKS